jgi:hypothetical protein
MLAQVFMDLQILLMSKDSDPLSCIELLFKPEYKQLRKKLNACFQVGEVEPFTKKVEEDTEFGDFTDVIILSMLKNYPPEKFNTPHMAATTFLTHSERLAWRNEMIKEQDEMVQR